MASYLAASPFGAAASTSSEAAASASSVAAAFASSMVAGGQSTGWHGLNSAAGASPSGLAGRQGEVLRDALLRHQTFSLC